MRFEFHKPRLKALYCTEKGAQRYASGVVDAFFEVMQVIDSALDERDLRMLKSLHFERLKGKRRHHHSVRLNDQFRLTLELDTDKEGKYVRIIDIEDYHR